MLRDLLFASPPLRQLEQGPGLLEAACQDTLSLELLRRTRDRTWYEQQDLLPQGERRQPPVPSCPWPPWALPAGGHGLLLPGLLSAPPPGLAAFLPQAALLPGRLCLLLLSAGPARRGGLSPWALASGRAQSSWTVCSALAEAPTPSATHERGCCCLETRHGVSASEVLRPGSGRLAGSGRVCGWAVGKGLGATVAKREEISEDRDDRVAEGEAAWPPWRPALCTCRAQASFVCGGGHVLYGDLSQGEQEVSKGRLGTGLCL